MGKGLQRAGGRSTSGSHGPRNTPVTFRLCDADAAGSGRLGEHIRTQSGWISKLGCRLIPQSKTTCQLCSERSFQGVEDGKDPERAERAPPSRARKWFSHRGCKGCAGPGLLPQPLCSYST